MQFFIKFPLYKILINYINAILYLVKFPLYKILINYINAILYLVKFPLYRILLIKTEKIHIQRD